MSTKTRTEIYERIDSLRAQQEEKHGGATHDNLYSRRDWIGFAVHELGKAEEHCDESATGEYVTAMLSTAAVCIGAVESAWRQLFTPDGARITTPEDFLPALFEYIDQHADSIPVGGPESNPTYLGSLPGRDAIRHAFRLIRRGRFPERVIKP